MNRYVIPAGVIAAIIVVGGGSAFALPKYQSSDFQKTINKVEAIRAQDLSDYTELVDQRNKLGEAIEVIVAEDKDYTAKTEALKKIDNVILDAKRDEAETVLRAQQAIDEFKPGPIVMLNRSYKEAADKAKVALNLNKDVINRVAQENRAEYASAGALSAALVDLHVLGDALSKDDIDTALTAAAPLQKYTRSNFSYPDEPAFAATYPQTSDTINKAKALFAKSYDYLVAIKKNDRATVAKIQPSLETDYSTLTASLGNALEEKNPKFTTLYQDYGRAIQGYYDSLRSVKGVKIDEKREQVAYLINAIELEYNRNDKYPQSTTLTGLKAALSTEYGSDDFFKYSSDKEMAYTVEYRTGAKDTWTTLAVK